MLKFLCVTTLQKYEFLRYWSRDPFFPYIYTVSPIGVKFDVKVLYTLVSP